VTSNGREARLAFDACDIVGESLIWEERSRNLVWVDIVGRRIHRLDPGTLDHESWATPDLVTSIGLRQDGGAIVGLRKEIAFWDFGGAFRPIAEIEPDRPETRLNEGVVGPDGTFWVGTMENNIGPDDAPRAISGDDGRIYRVDQRGEVTLLCEDRFGITNTMVWMADGRFVTADTMKNQLYRYRWNQAAARLEGRETFFENHDRGLPDGSCIDREGYIWNCRVAGGGCVVRIAPDGRLDRVIDLPCTWPTSCAFGGVKLDTLFITSARFTMENDHLEANPQEGGLFAVVPGVRGLPTNRFG
jgi:sugar lactone lactonase YvrE